MILIHAAVLPYMYVCINHQGVSMMILTRVVELRQLVGASTLSKGLSSHSVIRNAAKEEVRLLVMMRVS